jgi:hypothetical protein
MDLVIRVVDQPNSADLRSLAAALRDSDQVAGEVVLVREGPLTPDRLGAWVDVVSVAVGTGGAMTVLVRELARYLLRHGTDLEIELSRGPDGTRLRMSGKGLRTMSASELERTVRQMGNSLNSQDSGHQEHD